MRLLALVLAFLAGPALAGDYVDPIRALVDSGDPAKIEASLTELRGSAVAGDDGPSFWHDFDRAFDTSRPDRLKAVRAWRIAFPDSGLALAAEARARFHIGMLIRAGHDVLLGNDPRQDRSSAEFGKAGALALDAINRDPSNVSAYMTALRVQDRGGLPREPRPILRALLAVQPSREAVVLAALAQRARVLADVEELARFCSDFAPQVPDYSPDLCLAEAVLGAYVQGEIADRAKALLVAQDDPWFGQYRFDWLADYNTPEDVRTAQMKDWAVDWHQNRLDEADDLIGWLRDGNMFGYRVGNDDYVAEVQARFDEAAARALENDPYDSQLAQAVARMAVQASFFPPGGAAPAPFDSARIRQIWLNSAVYGAQESGFWEIGSYTVKNPMDAATVYPYLANAIADMNSALPPMVVSMARLSEIEADALARQANGDVSDPTPQSVLAALECPMARLARLIAGTCKADPTLGQMCDPAAPGMDRVTAYREKMAVDGICPDVAASGLMELGFAGHLPVADLDDFLAGFDQGLD